jgi:ATP/ADP translocase
VHFRFANEINTVEEAKTYYPAFGLVANVALIFSGQYVKIVSMIRASLAPGVDAWGYSLKLLMAAIVVGGGAILGDYTACARSIRCAYCFLQIVMSFVLMVVFVHTVTFILVLLYSGTLHSADKTYSSIHNSTILTFDLFCFSPSGIFEFIQQKVLNDPDCMDMKREATRKY